MAISYPLAFPTSKVAAQIALRARTAAGVSVSPFSYAQQVYAHQGEAWAAEVTAPPMKRSDAAAWVAFLVKLNGRVGTFLMGDPDGATPRGTWGGTPLLVGSHAARAKTLSVDGLSAGATGKEMDWIQFGSGATTRLHMVVADFTANGGGAASIEIWPGLRETQADNAPVVKSATQGLWRLASNERDWSIEKAQIYGVRFTAVEVL